MAHTPGPWVVAGKATINSPKRGWIASVSTVDREDNARLIAAAPTLLTELRSILAWALTEKIPLRQQEIDSIRAAISKATPPDASS